MSFFNFFKRKQTLVDDYFGELQYFASKKKGFSYYEGNIKLDQQECSIAIDADEKGPTKAQKQFVTELAAKYQSFKINVLIPFLDQELMEGREETLLVDFDKAFKVDGVSLQKSTKDQVRWGLTLFSSKIDHWVTIEFEDLRPIPGVVIDG